jgi:hypothetical protein
MRYWQRKKSNSAATHDARTWRQRLGGVLKILSQVVAILGTIMAIVDALHRW